MSKPNPWDIKKYKKNASYAKNSIPRTKTFLIVCEGQNTEPGYFESFPVASKQVVTIGTGTSKTSLVNLAIRESRKAENKGREVWCVFDYDIKRDQEAALKRDFNEAIALATRQSFKVAYSNDSFELWFILHYQYLINRLTRHQYYPIIEKLWNINNYEKYCKSIRFSRTIYERLQNDPNANQERAIQFAKNLKEEHAHKDYCDHVPCTTVYELVEELNKYLKK